MPTPAIDTGRPTWLEIDLDAVRHNFLRARHTVDPGVAVFPVIKADGYGLGALPIARALSKAGADGFCVALVEEAEALRQGGIRLPIVLLSGLYAGLEEAVARLQLHPFVFDAHTLPALSRAAGSKTLSIFLKVDTGMGRLGLAPEDVPTAVAQTRALSGLTLAGIVSHMACADQPDHAENQAQLEGLKKVLAQPDMAGLSVSLANSAALLSRPETHFSWIRPGIMLYGASPFFPTSSGREIGLRPVVHWRTHILQARTMPAGSAVGYNRTFITQRPTRMALLPVGYADGYNRLLSNRGEVLVAGRRVPVIGRVSMDLTAIDVTDIPGAVAGCAVTLLGEEGGEPIDVEEMAAWRETIPYEVLCDLGQRLPRRYTGAEETTPDVIPWSSQNG